MVRFGANRRVPGEARSIIQVCPVGSYSMRKAFLMRQGYGYSRLYTSLGQSRNKRGEQMGELSAAHGVLPQDNF